MLKLFASVAMMILPNVESEGFFVDWSAKLCVESCVGAPPCAGRKNYPWEELFSSLQQCCTKALSWKESECLIGGTSEIPTEIFFVDWGINLCVQECFGEDPCSNQVRSFWEEPYSSLQQCCSTALSWVSSDRCLRLNAPTKKPNIFDRPTKYSTEEVSYMPYSASSSEPSESATDTPSTVSSEHPSSAPTPTATRSPSNQPSPASSVSASSVPTNVSREGFCWYPNLWTQHCVYGPGLDWMRLPWNAQKYLKKSQEDCCEEHGCIAMISNTEPPSTAPSVALSAAQACTLVP